MTLIEKMAKAIYDRRFRDDSFTQKVLFGGPLTFEELMAGTKDGSIVAFTLEEFMGEARDALAAAREPTDSMHSAGREAFAIGDLPLPDEVWEAMIDAALEEK